MKRRILLALLASVSSLSGGEWRPQVQERGEALYGLVFSADGNWALSSGGDTWASRYASQVVLRLWSVQAQACLWKVVIEPGREPGQVMAEHLAILEDRSCIVHWTEFGNNSDETLRGRWLGRVSASGEWVWKVEVPEGRGLLSLDGKKVGFRSSDNQKELPAVLLSDGSRINLPSAEFSTPPSLVPADGGGDPTTKSGVLQFKAELLSEHSASIVAKEGGVESWRREVTTAESIYVIDEVQIEGAPPGRWVAWSSGRMLLVLDAATGQIRFQSNRIEGRPTLVYPGEPARELWLYTAPRKDASYENQSESMLARLSLDGSSLLTPVPTVGTLCWADRKLAIEDRYLVCANFHGPMAVWCWDLSTLTLLWFHEGPVGGWENGGLSYEDGTVFVSWNDSGMVEAFKLEEGSPIANGSSRTQGPGEGSSLNEASNRGIPQNGKVLEDSQGNPYLELSDHRQGAIDPEAFSHRGRWGAVNVADAGVNRTVVVNLSTGYEVELLVQRNGDRVPEWIAMDREGRFEGSAGAGSLVTMNRGLSIFPIDQFAASLNRPEEILERLGTSDDAALSSLRSQLNQRRSELPPSPASTDGLPEVLIRSVESRDGVATVTCKVVKGTEDATFLQAYVNNVPLFGKEGKPLHDGPEPVVEIPLSQSNNKIEFECVDEEGRTSPRAVFHIANPTKAAQGVLRFLGVGCSDYLHDAIPDLGYAHTDATDMKDGFSRLVPAMAASSVTLTNADATQAGIEKALSSLEGAGIADTVILFFAGHGCQFEDSYFFLCHDANPDAIPKTAVSFAEIEGALYRCKARKKLLLLDTCASGQFATDLASSAGSDGSSPRRFVARSLSGKLTRHSPPGWEGGLGRRFSDNDLFRRSGTVVISACAADEVSLESAEWENGAFTEAVLATFGSPSADSDGDGMLQKDELLHSCRVRVERLIRDLGDEGVSQTPSLDRDNLLEDFSLPFLEKAGSPKAIFQVEEGSLPDQAERWDGAVGDTGLAEGLGFLRSDSGRNYHGAMVRGRFEGIVTLSTPTGPEQFSRWRDGRRISDWRSRNAGLTTMPPAAEVPPAPPQDPILMARVGVAGYMATTNGALVWNNFPAATDVAHWEGAIDGNGFATGQGILRWFKGDRFSTGYMGIMIRGKLEGESISQDADGDTSRVWWKDGKKVRR